MAKLSREEILEVLAPLFAMDESVMDLEMPTVWQVPEGYKLDVFTLNGVKSFETMESNKENDLILGITNQFLYKQVMNPVYAGDEDITNPYLSPLHGDFRKFPQILV